MPSHDLGNEIGAAAVRLKRECKDALKRRLPHAGQRGRFEPAAQLLGEGRRLAAGAGGGEVDARPARVDRAQDGGGPGRPADGEGDLLGGGLRHPHDP